MVPLFLPSTAEPCHDGQSTQKLNHHFLTRTALHNAFENPSRNFRREQENASQLHLSTNHQSLGFLRLLISCSSNPPFGVGFPTSLSQFEQ